jgi:hypothetical protein
MQALGHKAASGLDVSQALEALPVGVLAMIPRALRLCVHAQEHTYFSEFYLGILPREQLEQMAAEGYNFL